MKKIVVFGEIYSPNVGDGLIYESIEYLFGCHDIQTIPGDLSCRNGWADDVVEISASSVSLIRKICRIPMRRIRLLRRLYSAIQWYFFRRLRFSEVWEPLISNSDGVIIGGGQLLTDMDFGFPPKIHEIARLAKKHNKPLALFGIGVSSKGWGLVAKYLYRRAICSACYVSCRDGLSASIVRGYVPNTDVQVHPDPAFVISEITRFAELKEHGDPSSLGINFQDVSHFRTFVPSLRGLTDEKYIDFWVSLIGDAQDCGYSPLIFTNGDPGDFRFALEVRERLVISGREIALYPRAQRPIDLVSQVASVRNVIATRMHAGIISYALGGNNVAISWDRKVDTVWQSLGMEEKVAPSSILLERNTFDFFISRLNGNENRTNQILLNRMIRDLHAATALCISKFT